MSFNLGVALGAAAQSGTDTYLKLKANQRAQEQAAREADQYQRTKAAQDKANAALDGAKDATVDVPTTANVPVPTDAASTLSQGAGDVTAPGSTGADLIKNYGSGSGSQYTPLDQTTKAVQTTKSVADPMATSKAYRAAAAAMAAVNPAAAKTYGDMATAEENRVKGELASSALAGLQSGDIAPVQHFMNTVVHPPGSGYAPMTGGYIESDDKGTPHTIHALFMGSDGKPKIASIDYNKASQMLQTVLNPGDIGAVRKENAIELPTSVAQQNYLASHALVNEKNAAAIDAGLPYVASGKEADIARTKAETNAANAGAGLTGVRTGVEGLTLQQHQNQLALAQMADALDPKDPNYAQKIDQIGTQFVLNGGNPGILRGWAMLHRNDAVKPDWQETPSGRLLDKNSGAMRIVKPGKNGGDDTIVDIGKNPVSAALGSLPAGAQGKSVLMAAGSGAASAAAPAGRTSAIQGPQRTIAAVPGTDAAPLRAQIPTIDAAIQAAAAKGDAATAIKLNAQRAQLVQTIQNMEGAR